ncbi:SDR family NAD(P)-dependent oxidoreductase [Streptomyces europaeiscabiei]|uniref:SDR family NAD(P)-dependent oxidoreductase n=1 Tax=Streptomyces europaeiscabiei TaxID=146819 RepID=UPI0038D35F6A
MPFDARRPTFAVNVDGTFLASKAFLPDLKQSGSGHVINITSWSGPDGRGRGRGRCRGERSTPRWHHGDPVSAPTRRRPRSPTTCSPPPERPGPSAA